VSFSVWLIYCGLFLETVLLGLQIFRRTYKRLPTFFIYSCWNVLIDPAVFIAGRYSHRTFVNTYLVQLAMDAFFMFFVLLEIMTTSAKESRRQVPIPKIPGTSLRTTFSILLFAAALLLWPVSGLLLPHSLLDRIDLFAYQLEYTLALLRIILFVGLSSFSDTLGISWRDRELQLATGLGGYSLFNVIVLFLHGQQKRNTHFHFVYLWLDIANSVVYALILIYWDICFWQKDREREQQPAHVARDIKVISKIATDSIKKLERDGHKQGKRQ